MSFLALRGFSVGTPAYGLSGTLKEKSSFHPSYTNVPFLRTDLPMITFTLVSV